MVLMFLDGTENNVRKGENACYLDILLFLRCFQNAFFPGVLKFCCTNLLKTPLEKEKLLVTSNFSFSPQGFLNIWRTFHHFHKT